MGMAVVLSITSIAVTVWISAKFDTCIVDYLGREKKMASRMKHKMKRSDKRKLQHQLKAQARLSELSDAVNVTHKDNRPEAGNSTVATNNVQRLDGTDNR